MTETRFRVGPGDLKPLPDHSAVPCDDCGGTAWASVNAYERRCVDCGRVVPKRGKKSRGDGGAWGGLTRKARED